MLLFFALRFWLRLHDDLTLRIFASVCATAHDEGEFIGVVFMLELVNFDRIKVKQVNELRQFLNLNHFVLLSSPVVITVKNLI